MSVFFRRRVEATIEHMIGLLDQMDGDADFEPESVEEQHDREADSWTTAENCVLSAFIKRQISRG